MTIIRAAVPLTVLAALFAAASCQRTSAPPPAPAVASTPAPKQHEPTAERLRERCQDRWVKIEQQDWIGAYDMLAPEPKRALPPAQFLAQKAPNEYRDPRIVEVVRVEDDLGYVRTTAMWTPHHAKLQIGLDPESAAHLKQRFPEKIEQIETWRFAEGDWGWFEAKDPTEFFQEHPEFLRAQGEKSALPTPAPAAGKQS